MWKLLLTIFAFVYLLFPSDLLPDVVLGWGWLDDLVVLYLWWRGYRWFDTGGPAQKPAEEPDGQTRSSDQKTAAFDSTDPYTVLGIDRQAAPEEIHQAYKKLAAQYHPDKLAHLGDEFRALAEKKFKQIQQAYDTLKKNR